MDNYRVAIRRQLDLEAESRSLGEDRYARSRPMPWKSGADARAADEEANLPPGQYLLKKAVEPTAEAIKAFVRRANSGKAGRLHTSVKWLELAKPEEVAYLAARVALNFSATRSAVQSAAIALGNAIIDHIDMNQFKGKNPGGYYGLIRKGRRAVRSEKRMEAVRKLLESEEARSTIPQREKLQLGMAALELLVDATGLFVLDTVPKEVGRGYILRPTEPVERWLSEQHDRSALLEPVLLPMVVRPRRWRNPWTGGYLRRLYGRTLVKQRDRKYQDLLASTDLSKVYEAVNHIQETPWRINTKVLDVMAEVWDAGDTLGGLPARDDLPLPPKPEGLDEDDARLKTWKREAAQVYEENARLMSQRLVAQQRLWIAGRFRDEREVFFPHALDFRGRVYPIPATAIHPQADDPGKALLEFAHGLPIGKQGGYWLAVHIANLFGVDKVSFADRVEWTFDHAEQLIDSATDPLDGQRFWTEADDPWSALAAAYEFAAYLEHGDSYVSHLPIPVDGSNSGLQHFSAMLRDRPAAEAVNLVPTDRPADVYQQVADRTQEIVDADTDPAASAWHGGKVTRAIAKRPTMTFVYSATRYGVQDMILKTLQSLDAKASEPHLGGADNYDAARYLSYVMFDAIKDVVSSASRAMDWLRHVATVAADAMEPLVWTTPDGLPVQQAYRTPVGNRVKVHWRGQLIYITLVTDSPNLDSRAQLNGIAPNFVHSLDAAHLRAVARAAKKAGIQHLAVIHDSFATHAARTDDLVDLLRETFVEQYEPDVLEEFRQEVQSNLPDGFNLAPPPKKGDLRLEEVLLAPYLFA